MAQDRKNEWSPTILREAPATVNKPSWVERLSARTDVTHDRVAQRFSVKAPLQWDGPRITKAIQEVIQEEYRDPRDSNYNNVTPTSSSALYRSFTQCLFIDEERGDIVFKPSEQTL